MSNATVGRIVHYKLSSMDVTRIIQSRGSAPNTGNYNSAAPGDIVPMLVVRAWDTGGNHVNGQAFLDGPDSIWLNSIGEGDGEGQWSWPKRA